MPASLAPKRATAHTGHLPHTPWTQLMRSRGGDMPRVIGLVTAGPR